MPDQSTPEIDRLREGSFTRMDDDVPLVTLWNAEMAVRATETRVREVVLETAQCQVMDDKERTHNVPFHDYNCPVCAGRNTDAPS